MLSVLAFKRSLSAGILDGGMGEISLGGSRLNRFMKDVENVTGHMGCGETVSPAEEAEAIEPVPAVEDKADTGEVEQDTAHAAPAQVSPDPWGALLQFGASLVTALAATHDSGAASHPWIERDPFTGNRSLKMPLPPPETARKLADALSLLADTLRGRQP